MTRSEEIVSQYFAFLEKHIQEVISGTVPEFMEVNEIAGELAVSHKHLTDTVKKKPGSIPVIFMMKKLFLRQKNY